MTAIPDPDAAWAAFMARDRRQDGRFVVGVTSTGIYCRPSCAARRPRREHVRFFQDAEGARAAGLRACRRCRPDEVARDEAAVAAALALLDTGEVFALATLAARVGYAPHHFQRVFTRATGVSPAGYARGARAARADAALASGETVTEAVYAAGYSAPSRFYEKGAPRLGMAAASARRGGHGETIRWTVVTTSLGPLLVAATNKGLCRVAFDEDEAALARRFPAATLVAGDAALAELATRVVAAAEQGDPGAPPLPLDARGTAFQERVWRALATIPPGETRSYAELAGMAGSPAAVRAAASACAANPVAIAIPCHRVTRGDGATGGYAWGPARKEALLARERG